MSAPCGLITDFYELTMVQGYYLEENYPEVVFDLFYRSQPFGSGFAIFAGLQDALEGIRNFAFSSEDIDYLRSLGNFRESFLTYLKDFRFTGDIYAMDEGSVVFPGEPLVRVHGNLIEAQLIESYLLNVINFQSLIATKSARVVNASGGGKVIEFGLRRAQGLDGAMSATRAAYIGGVAGTSNTLGGKRFGIPVMGTMAHSWVMAYPDELESFRKFAGIYPETAILLIDTYDTLNSGLKHAITVGKELKKQGKRLGVRIDSGDLSYLSKKVRKALDAEGLYDALITVSNDLNEEIIHQLVAERSPIDAWGVGTNLVTGGSQAAMNGVYKLSAKKNGGAFVPTMKLSNHVEKTTNPGIKQVFRFFSGSEALGDLIILEEEGPLKIGEPYTFNHPLVEHQRFIMRKQRYTYLKQMLQKKMESGTVLEHPTLEEIRTHAQEGLASLDDTYKRIINPHIYKVSISDRLKELKGEMIHQFRKEFQQ